MHYKDGTEAKLGDIVSCEVKDWYEFKGALNRVSGMVVSLNPGAQSCNANVMIINRQKTTNNLMETALPSFPILVIRIFTCKDLELIHRDNG